MRDQRRIWQATAAAALLSAVPSTLAAAVLEGEGRSALQYLLATTRGAGSLLPPGRPGLARGVIVHCGMSVICGQLLARTLPQRHSACWGATAGLALGIVNIGVIGQRFPQIKGLPRTPQIADHVALGAAFALVVDR